MAGIKSYFKIMMQNFKDQIFKKVNYCCILERENWIDDKMQHDEEMINAAKESQETIQRRKKLKVAISNLEKCEETLNQLQLN